MAYRCYHCHRCYSATSIVQKNFAELCLVIGWDPMYGNDHCQCDLGVHMQEYQPQPVVVFTAMLHYHRHKTNVDDAALETQQLG